MQVAVEYIGWIQEERAKINRADLEDIEFFENGMKLEIPKEVIEKFEYCGLNNTDFILSGEYKRRRVKMGNCEHANLYPSMPLQFKMMRCGHYLIQGDWECTDCNEWIRLEMEDEWDGGEGSKTKDGKYQYQRIKGENKMVKLKL